MTITKVTETTNYTCRAKKNEWAQQQNFLRRFAQDVCPPHFETSSSASGSDML